MMSIKGLLTLIETSGLVIKIAMAAGLVALVLVAYGVWHHKVYDEGWYAALASIARADAKTIARATEYRNAWKACHATGRDWNQTSGNCS
jgi:hypothetical protein